MWWMSLPYSIIEDYMFHLLHLMKIDNTSFLRDKRIAFINIILVLLNYPVFL